jgi:hypothetical protein
MDVPVLFRFMDCGESDVSFYLGRNPFAERNVNAPMIRSVYMIFPPFEKIVSKFRFNSVDIVQ